jgi:hypothetical protein
MPPPIMVVVGLRCPFDLVLLSIAIASIHFRYDGACLFVASYVESFHVAMSDAVGKIWRETPLARESWRES